MTEPTSKSSDTKVRWMIVALLMGFTFLGHFNRTTMAVAGSERLTGPNGMTDQQMGWIYSSFLIVYTLLMLPGGRVIDRFGPRLALAAMGLGSGLCIVLSGALGLLGWPVASLWVPFLAIRGLAGGFSVPLHPAAARSISFWIPLKSRTFANGLVTAGALIGYSLSFPVFGSLMDRVDWPMALIVCGVAMMLFSVVWLLLSSDHANQHPWSNEAERQLVSVNDIAAPEAPRASMGQFIALFQNHRLLLLTISYSAVSYIQYLFFYWINHYFEKQLHLSARESRNNTFVIMMAMAVGMTVGGIVTDFLCRHWGRRIGCRAIAMSGMGLSALFAWWGIKAEQQQDVVWLFSMSFACLGLCEGIFWTTAPLFEPSNGGMAGAFLNTLSNGVGFVAPVLSPWIAERYGWDTAIAVACSICALGAALWLLIDPTGDNETEAPAVSGEV